MIAEGFLVLGASFIVGSIWQLVQPAKVTSACDELGDAIDELPAAKTPGDAKLRMPTMEQDWHIESLLRYVRGHNRGKGMGFVLFSKRINYSFVIAILTKAVSVMTLLFPILLSFTRGGEDHQDELPNSTWCAC